VDRGLDGLGTTSTAKAKAIGQAFANLEAICAAWPQIAADDSGVDSPDDIQPITCKQVASDSLPPVRAPFEELELVEVTADRMSRKLLAVRVATSWYLVESLESSYEENRGGGDSKVVGLVFQELAAGVGASLLMKVDDSTWSMAHDDDSEETHSSGNLTLKICKVGPGGLACLEIPYGEYRDGDAEGDETYRSESELVLDGKGRVHVGIPKGVNSGSAEQKLQAVFELSFP